VSSSTWADWSSETPVSYTTTVVSAITTYVPWATQFNHAGKTYDISSATTLTITDCPCTISVPVYTQTSTSCRYLEPHADSCDFPQTDSSSTWADWSSASSVAATSAVWTSVAAASTTSAAWATYAPSSAAVAAATYTGAANGLVANVGAGLAGVGAVAAFFL
jgi:hypothetical protein